jgi:uncharacterized Fe-S cluster-containing MiaB family protein
MDILLTALARHAAIGTAPTRLEVAMGLETVHPDALDKLNKRMTVDDFVLAAGRLRRRDVALRVFLLIGPPGIAGEEQDEWLGKSVDAAFACGATAVSLVPTRGGNGAMEALSAAGAFREPRLADIERSVSSVLSRAPKRIFVDLWDLERFSDCPVCFERRRARLQTMNLEQRVERAVACLRCGS